MAEGGGISARVQTEKAGCGYASCGSCLIWSRVAGDRRESLKLHRDEWGYLSISIESDAPFLLPEKSQLTDEDFIGSTLEVPYYVKKHAMHAGKNFGRLSIVLPEQTLTFEVCATTGRRKSRIGGAFGITARTDAACTAIY